MAGRMELVQQIRFNGSTPTDKCTTDATSFVLNLENRAKTLTWDDAATASNAIACMEGPASDWVHETLKTELLGHEQVDRFETVTTSWMLLKPIFARRWGVKVATANSSILDLKQQRQDEGFYAFASRVVRSLGKHRDLAGLRMAVNRADYKAGETFPPIRREAHDNAEINDNDWTRLQTMTTFNRFRPWLDRYNFVIMTDGINNLITRMSLMHVKAGMREGNDVYKSVWNLPDTTTIAELLQHITTEEDKFNRAKKNKPPVKNGNYQTHHRVNALEAEEPKEPTQAQIAAAYKEKEKKKLTCSYCKRKNHSYAECRKRLAATAAGVENPPKQLAITKQSNAAGADRAMEVWVDDANFKDL